MINASKEVTKPHPFIMACLLLMGVGFSVLIATTTAEFQFLAGGGLFMSRGLIWNRIWKNTLVLALICLGLTTMLISLSLWYTIGDGASQSAYNIPCSIGMIITALPGLAMMVKSFEFPSSPT